MREVCIGLGGNLGPVLRTFSEALAALSQAGVQLTRISSAYRTRAVLPPDRAGPAPDFWNAACRGKCELSAHGLLRLLLQLEDAAGRVRRERWDSRPLDLDLLLVADEVCHTPELVLPHPRLGERTFVLRPLAEVAGEWVVPGAAATVTELQQRLADPNAGILECREDWREALVV